jgi:dTDP-4-dehydrorhamnose reductase
VRIEAWLCGLPSDMRAPELWGGVECTVNRVRDRYHDQLQLGGHDTRLCDLDRIAELGVRQLRYPVLWELTAPCTPDGFDWRWADARLERLRELHLDPIVGLLHHGSGPRYTNLLDPLFATLFARYARAFATRYPWVQRYTPINEPLTTARFSGLYGHWYPHRRDDRSFVRAVLNQCRAIVLAMREIRRVNPDAELIQTDDVGFTSSTPQLAYQARFDNERRWLAWDLLCGRVDSMHALWKYLRDSGMSDEDYAFFQQNPCVPGIIGVNHYATSDRHLSEHRELFPRSTWGGNGKHAYADVEAIRTICGPGSGFSGALQAAWKRYHLPLALTEVHLGCTREEQLRWLWQAWQQARQLRLCGLDVRAVTAWAMFGSFNWNSLLTSDTGHYESGAFDVRCAIPRPTALARLITALATGREFQPAALLQNPGWWQRPMRMFPSLLEGAAEDLPRPSVSRALADIFRDACDARALSLEDMASLRTSVRVAIDAALDLLIDEGSISEPAIGAEPAAPLAVPALPR